MSKDKTDHVNWYLKDIGNERLVFDYNKIYTSKFPLTLLISERGFMGKTFGFKEFALELYDSRGIGSYFMKNTEKLIDMEKPKSLMNHVLHDASKWEGVALEGNHFKKNGKSFMEFVALSTSENHKGSRDSSKQVLYVDEFNVGVTHVAKLQTFLFTNFLATMTTEYGAGVENPIKAIIAGNNKSLASPLLADLGIYTIEDEVTKIYSPSGAPLMLILVPKKSKEEVEELHASNWVHSIAEKTGQADHMFGNETQFDSMNGIIQDMDSKLHNCIHKAIYKISGREIDVWFNTKGSNKGIWFMNKVSDDVLKQFKKKRDRSKTTGLATIVAGTKNDLDGDEVQLTSSGKHTIREFIKKGQVKFDSMMVKKLVISCL